MATVPIATPIPTSESTSEDSQTNSWYRFKQYQHRRWDEYQC